MRLRPASRFQQGMFFSVFLASMVLGLILTSVSSAQIIYNPNDERFKQLALEKAVWTFKDEREKFHLAMDLASRDLISDRELKSSERTYRVAEVELKQALLALSQEAPHLVIERVVRHLEPDGKTIVKILFHNAGKLTGNRQIDEVLSETGSEISTADLFTLRNIYVSLIDSNTIIALPYEHRVEQLSPGDSVTLEYTLMRDVDAVTISASYSGRVDKKRVLIQQGIAGPDVLVSARPRAQESEFGTIAGYNLQFDCSGTQGEIYDLLLVGLPEQFTYRFVDPKTNAYVRKLIFPAATWVHQLRLEVSLPDRCPEGIVPDSVIQFDLHVADNQDGRAVGGASLELIPHGRGELTLNAVNWSVEGSVGDPPTIKLEVRNSGSVALQDIRWFVDGPSGWEFETDPPIITLIESGDIVTAEIEVTSLGTSSAAGIFEIDIRVGSSLGARRIESESKTIRMRLEGGNRTFNTIIITLLAVVLIGAVVVVTFRLSRR